MTIYLLTLPNGSFGSAGQSWSKLDLDKIKAELNFPVIIKTILDIENLNINEEDVIIYTSSPNASIRKYLIDKLYYLQKTNVLIPSYELLMAHENKGFQEVMKRTKKFGNLKGHYFFELEDQKLAFPKVLKTIEGAGSSGVFLVKKEKDVNTLEKKFFTHGFKRKLISTQRQFKLKSSEYKIYKYNKRKFTLFVEQDFIPQLEHDFKVLVFGDRYYVLKRSVRKNDFRASGSGKFDFVEAPSEVLEFAKGIVEILKAPYLSLDIAQSKEGCHLIEFQATNFGPYTLLNAPTRYIYKSSNWFKENNDKNLEANYAYALNYYFKSEKLS